MPSWMDDDLARLRTEGRLHRRRRLTSGQGAEVRYRRADLVSFAGDDYLAYAGDERLARAAARAARRYGAGAGGSPLSTGLLPPLHALERDLAAWEGAESALVFPSGYLASVAVLSALAGPEDVLFRDAGCGTGLADGCRLSGAAVHTYRHND